MGGRKHKVHATPYSEKNLAWKHEVSFILHGPSSPYCSLQVKRHTLSPELNQLRESLRRSYSIRLHSHTTPNHHGADHCWRRSHKHTAQHITLSGIALQQPRGLHPQRPLAFNLWKSSIILKHKIGKSNWKPHILNKIRTSVASMFYWGGKRERSTILPCYSITSR